MNNRQLSAPMTENDFQQLTLLANSIAIFTMAIKLEKQGSKRRAIYSDILMRLKRAERSIPGHLEGRITDQSVKFYNRLGEAVTAFLGSFKDAKPVGRDKKGKFTKL